MRTPASPSTPSTLVGRKRELGVLHEHLDAALAGQGSLVLIGGEAGIGKTALAETICREATEQGALVLIGRCYDLTETPPYGPWVELFGRYRQTDGMPPLPPAFSKRGTVAEAMSQAALFQHVLDFLTALGEHQPVVLLLDDAHWMDAASLDLLRLVARNLAALPLLIAATYRSEAVSRAHPLHTLIPILVREAAADRLDPRLLDDAAVRLLVRNRYGLASADTDRLVAHLRMRGEGNPLFVGELLRTLEEGGTLRCNGDGWILGPLIDIGVPPLLRQVIDARVARLDAESQRLLAVAAVVGQTVPLVVWATVGDADEGQVLAVAEAGLAARLLAEAESGEQVRFAHTLIREALYASIPAIRRRGMHRRVGDAFVAVGDADPDAVAYHFQKAADDRAAEWLVRAGERAQRVYAWATAAERFEAALALLDSGDTDPGQRGWLCYRLGRMRRFADPRRAIAHFDDAFHIGEASGDRTLAAAARFNRGACRMHAGEYDAALADEIAGVETLESLDWEEHARRARHDDTSAAFDRSSYRGTLMLHLANLGHLADVLAMRDRAPDAAPFGDGHRGLGIVHLMLGEPDAAQAANARARAAFTPVSHHANLGFIALIDLTVALAYQADDIAGRRQAACAVERAWGSAHGVGFAVDPRLGCAHLLIVEGAWGEARTLLAGARESDYTFWRHFARAALGVLSREQGEPEEAAEAIRGILPAGPATPAGALPILFLPPLQRLAASLAIDTDDLPTARAWLGAHDRCLAATGAVLGQSEGHLCWATYYRCTGDVAKALAHADRALTHATEPRQPLALLAAHRLLGELATEAGCLEDAATHLDASLRLADACAAPFERALTLLAHAELLTATGDHAEAMASLAAVHAICLPLGAKPVLSKVDSLITRLGALRRVLPAHPAGLSVREVEVLRLIAAGRTNREIAETLSISIKTVINHVTHILTKTNLPNRTAAVAFALQQGIMQ